MNIYEEDAVFYLLGSGIYSFLDLTLITQHILTEKCKSVYYLHDLPSFEKYLLKLFPKAENLMPIYYLDGQDRNQIYHNIVQHVLQTPEARRPAALLLHGHPLVFSTISQRLIKECEEKNLKLAIFPAVSSLDRMIVELKLDIGFQGVQVFNAAYVVLNKRLLNPSVGCFLYQVGTLNSMAERNQPARPEEIRILKEYLLGHFPRSHVVKIIECSVEVGFESRVTAVEIGKLEEALAFFDYNASMYIPPLPLEKDME